MKRIINMFIISIITTISLFAADLKGANIGDDWILSEANGVDVVSKKSVDGNATFSVANVNGQLVAIVTNNTDPTITTKGATPIVRELQVLGPGDVGYRNNTMLIGNNYFQYLEYWQLLHLNVPNIKIIMQDRSDKMITSAVNMKGYVNALKRVYSNGKNSKGEDKYVGYKNIGSGWQYKETPEYKEISKEFSILPEVEKDYGQLRNRIVIRNYNGVLWSGLLLARPFDMRNAPDEVELYTEKAVDKVYVVSPVGSLDDKPQNIKMTITENAIKELKASKTLYVDVVPEKDGDYYDDGIDASEVDLKGFSSALKKLGKYRVAGVEDLK